MLALMAQADRPLSSTYIAESVNTNPVTIRKVLGCLNAADLITTQMGADGGAVLARSAETISLLDIYHATDQGDLFAHHPKAPNPACQCGQHITTVLDSVFDEAQSAMFQALENRKLSCVVRRLKTSRELLPA